MLLRQPRCRALLLRPGPLSPASVPSVRHKLSVGGGSTGVAPLLQRPPPLLRPRAYPEAGTAGRSEPRTLPAEIPEVLRSKLQPDAPGRAHPRKIPANLRRKAREQGYLQPLDDVVAAHVEGSFRVARSRMGNFPIYTDVRNGGTKVVTILRKYSGDAHSLARALQAVTGKEVTQYHGRMEVRGRHASAMAEWLGRIGM